MRGTGSVVVVAVVTMASVVGCGTQQGTPPPAVSSSPAAVSPAPGTPPPGGEQKAATLTTCPSGLTVAGCSTSCGGALCTHRPKQDHGAAPQDWSDYQSGHFHSPERLEIHACLQGDHQVCCQFDGCTVVSGKYQVSLSLHDVNASSGTYAGRTIGTLSLPTGVMSSDVVFLLTDGCGGPFEIQNQQMPGFQSLCSTTATCP